MRYACGQPLLPSQNTAGPCQRGFGTGRQALGRGHGRGEDDERADVTVHRRLGPALILARSSVDVVAAILPNVVVTEHEWTQQHDPEPGPDGPRIIARPWTFGPGSRRGRCLMVTV